MKLSWSSNRRGSLDAELTARSSARSSARKRSATPRGVGGDRHPGIYRSPAMNSYEQIIERMARDFDEPRAQFQASQDNYVVGDAFVVELCSSCFGAGCGRCNLTGRVCARAKGLPPENALLFPTGGIPKGSKGTNDMSSPFDGLYEKPQFSNVPIPDVGAVNVKRGRPTSCNDTSLLTRSGGRDSPTQTSDSEPDSGASLSGDSGSRGTTTASEQCRRGRSLDSPKQISDSESNSGSSFFGAPPTSCSKTKKCLRGRSPDCSKQLSDSESNSGASLSGFSGSGGTTTASEKFSRGRSLESPPTSDATPTLDPESSSDSGRSLDGCTNSPPEKEVHVRSSSLDSPTGSRSHSKRSPQREAALSTTPRFGSIHRASRKEFQARHVVGSPIQRERWHQAAANAKERAGVLGYEFKTLDEEMSELAADLRRLRSYVQSTQE